MAGEILTPAFDALCAIEQAFADANNVQLFPIMPRSRPKEDCLWNWILPDEENGAEWIGTGPTHRDVIRIRATIAVRESASDQEQVRNLLRYTDAFLSVIDPALNPRLNPQPLGSCVRRAERLGMGTGLHAFGDNKPPLLGMDFPIELQITRNFP